MIIVSIVLTLIWRQEYHPRLAHDTLHPPDSSSTVQPCRESRAEWDLSSGGSVWSERASAALPGSGDDPECWLSWDVSWPQLLTWWLMSSWRDWRDGRIHFLQHKNNHLTVSQQKHTKKWLKADALNILTNRTNLSFFNCNWELQNIKFKKRSKFTIDYKIINAYTTNNK